jgi:hypothetical protein
MTRKKMRMIIIISSIALAGVIVMEYREQGLYAILAGITASGLSFIRDNVFRRSPTLHSQLLYHTTTAVVVALGLMYMLY